MAGFAERPSQQLLRQEGGPIMLGLFPSLANSGTALLLQIISLIWDTAVYKYKKSIHTCFSGF